MRGEWVVRGVPESIRTDGWWLTEVLTEGVPDGQAKARRKDRLRIAPAPLVVVALLTVTADLLFWDAELGLSVAVYTLLLTACMIAFKPAGATRREAAIAIGAVILCALPVMEQVHPLSVMFCVIGLGGLLGWVAFGSLIGPWASLVLVLRASTLGATELPQGVVDAARHAPSRLDVRSAARALVLPLGAGAVFVILFASANPLLEALLSDVGDWGLPPPEQILRAVFWLVVACALWPYLNPRGAWRGAPAMGPTARSFAGLESLITPASVRTSMILFNAMFAVQTVTDLSVLSGGLTLPEGLSYAEYAHRGAYPLVVTALLSGLLAIATHHMTRGNRLLRGLMLLWLGQNMVLVLTALFRLDLYVDAYMLTHLRVAAFIWMGLTLGSLILIVVYILQAQPLVWLVRGVGELTLATLYLCCFVNFAYIIAEYNMTAHPDGRLDLGYLCGLGEQAIPAMIDYGEITDNVACGRGNLPGVRFEPIDDWRDWGFRRWRLQRYLETFHDL